MKKLIGLIISLLFSLHFFKAPFVFYADIETATHSSPLPHLDQAYTYLAQGSQMYAFVSQDGHTILKLFKACHKKKPKFSRLFRNATQKQISQNKWKGKFENSSRRYKMALRDLKEETGLIALHFEKTRKPLITRLNGKSYNLSHFPFILQKRAILVPDYITPNNKRQVEQALKELFSKRTKKGYTDPRQTLSTNYGFIEGKAVQIDVGKIEPLDQKEAKEELQRLFQKVDRWLLTHSLNG